LWLKFAVIFEETMILSLKKRYCWKMVKLLLAERSIRFTNYTEYDNIHYLSYALIIVLEFAENEIEDYFVGDV
jgi:hypothetical protein